MHLSRGLASGLGFPLGGWNPAHVGLEWCPNCRPSHWLRPLLKAQTLTLRPRSQI